MTLVDISSGAHKSGGETWGVYCSTKAAGVVLHQSIGKEQENCRVLNYSPGIMRTEMQETIAKGVDSPSKQFLAKVLDQNKEVPIAESVAKLLEVLEQDTFETGSYVDIYDSRGPPL
eukprot:CAMPEP_0117011968 /NCGR_PEP_ID=MMETSP0472-20121206/10177_1 /TAXON_ID=693140 ORGANISM="Tiarina fusus, Strain LIS" /NCGR_SAMPLE_ID=MMETSP0472 /ASSEMBLY_ACC=CAM_ASM_000603 /LENGTH=116 /DNA_ID=CAMNT_0004714925 /DNA_START=381 /DNA_END=731 /DNA_ORIENTATION=+